MPPGLKNNYLSFNRTMNLIFKEAINDYCSTDKGNLIVFSCTIDEHFDHLEKVLSLLSQNGIRVQQNKCKFCCNELVFNNNLIKENQLILNYRTVEIIQNWPIPRSVKLLNDFLDFVSQFKTYLNDYSGLTSVFEPVSSEKIPFKWSTNMNSSFEKIKIGLVKFFSIDLKSRESSQFVLFAHFTQTGYVCVLMEKNKLAINTPIALSRQRVGTRIDQFFANNRVPNMLWAIKQFKSLVACNKIQLSFQSMRPRSEIDTFEHLDEWIRKTQYFDIEIVNTVDVNKNCAILSRIYWL